MSVVRLALLKRHPIARTLVTTPRQSPCSNFRWGHAGTSRALVSVAGGVLISQDREIGCTGAPGPPGACIAMWSNVDRRPTPTHQKHAHRLAFGRYDPLASPGSAYSPQPWGCQLFGADCGHGFDVV
jgi:hypothetical protein